jgi:DNA-binding beta-propeller fold protein YncE
MRGQPEHEHNALLYRDSAASRVPLAFNPDNGYMYVAIGGDNTVSVIAPLTTTFSEGCNGTISNAGQTTGCTLTNAYGRPA